MFKFGKWERSVFSVLLAFGTTGGASAAPEVSIPYEVTRDSRVSLAVYGPDGRMARTLLTGAPRQPGRYTATWDGRDRYGHPLPAGRYTWRLLQTDGLRAEFITQVGQNPDPVWERGVSNHEPPMAAAVDKTGVYRIGSFDEGAHAGVKTDFQGRYLWTTDFNKVDPWCRFGAALSVIGDRLFMLLHNGTVFRFDKRTGESLVSGSGEGLWNLRWEGGPAKAEGKDAESLRHTVEEVGMDMSGASDAGLIAVSYRAQNAVRWFRADDGRLVGGASVPEPVAVTCKPDGTTLVLSRGAVVEVSREGDALRTVVPANQLTDPWRLCVSPKTGDFFIAENGALARRAIERPRRDFESGVAQDLAAGVISRPASGSEHHRVVRFSSEGKRLGAFGRAEGRRDGDYVPSDFRSITDIEADPEGGFVVTEGYQQPPRRSARFNANGRLLYEWYGAQEYGALAAPEPGRPDIVWLHQNATPGGFIRCQVDLKKKTWRVLETYRDSLAVNPLWGSGNTSFRIHERDGKLYLAATGFGPLGTLIYDPKAKTLRASNLSGRAYRDDKWAIPASLRPAGDAKPKSYLWNDLNDDGRPQPEEMTWHDHTIGGPTVGESMAVFTVPHASEYNAGIKLVPSRFTSGGTPVYRPDASVTWPAWREDGEAYRGWDVLQAPGGGWYASFSDAFRNPHENYGAWYFNSTSGIDRLVKWDEEWKPLWSVGRHSPDEDHETGSQAMPRGLVGFAHDCIIWADASDEELARPTVWTEDGLYVDELLRVPTDTMPKRLYGVHNTHEYPLGNLATLPNGDVIYYAVSTTGGSPVYRIQGWGDWRRQSGTVTLGESSEAVARRDGTGLRADFFNTPDLSGDPVVTRTDPMVRFHWLKGQDALPQGVNADSFSVRWTGRVEAPTSEEYRFAFETMTPWVGEGWGTPGPPRWLRLVVDGRTIIDTENGVGEPTVRGAAGRIALKAGERYDLRLEAGWSGNAVAKLAWDTPGLDRRIIRPLFLQPAEDARTAGTSPLIQTTAHPSEAKRTEAGSDRGGLLADFNFDAPDGNLYWSRTGAGVFGRLTGRAKRVSGESGRGIELDARGPFEPAVFVVDEELRLPTTDYTVAFRFRTTASDTRLCETKRYSPYNNRWSDHIVALQGGRVRFELQGDAPLETTKAFNDGQWHTVITTVGPGGQRLYVDGQLVGTGKLEKRTKTSNRLGLDLGPGDGPAVVAFDDLRVYDHALSPVEAAAGQ